MNERAKSQRPARVMTCERHQWRSTEPCVECSHDKQAAELLRDAAALSCVLPAVAILKQQAHERVGPPLTPARVASLAYELADAMLVERARRQAK